MMRPVTIAIVALLALMAAGCPRQQVGGPTVGPEPPVPTQRTQVSFLAMEYDTNTRPFMQKLEQQFEQANPEIDLRIEVIDWDAGFQKLSTLIAAENAPDLANIATLWLPEMVDLDVVEPLDGYVSEQMRERFIPMTLQGAQYQGKLYGLPIAVSARALYCNADLLAAAGKQPPRTWEELVEVAKACDSPDEGIYGFGLQGNKVETDVYWYYFLWANGGQILSEDGSQAVFNSPKGVQALQFCVDLVHKHQVTQPEPTAYNREGLQDLFKSGRLAMMITGPWFWGMLEKDVPNLHYTLAPIPAHTDQVTMAVTDNLIMFQSCADKDAAWKFIEFFYDPQLRLEWAKTFGMLPELKEVAENEYITSSEQWSLFMSLLPTGRFVPLHPRWTTIAEEIKLGIQEALLEQKTPQQALDDAAQRVNAILAGSTQVR
ncbi:MAG: sugar ABC transporter substrate-binding protein [Armatimonadota bacterium]